MPTNRTNTAVWSDKHSRWQINVQKDGCRRSFYSSTPGRTGQREANAKADLWLESGISSAKSRVKDLYERFQKELEPLSGASMKKQINTMGKVWIIPFLGNKKASQLCDGDIQKMLDHAAAEGRSKKTIQDINGMVNKFVKWCRMAKLTAYRPEEVKIPSSARLVGKKVLQPEDLKRLLACDNTLLDGKEVREPYINAYRFAILTGLRPGELRGLVKSDIVGNRVFVQRAINDYGEMTKGKNENAVRSFVMTSQAASVLKDQLERYPDEEYIFAIPAADVYRKHFMRYCAYNGIAYISPYEMRHTFVSVVKSLSAGEVKPIVGHSQSMDTFGIYSHYLEGEDTATAEKIEGLFTRITTKENA